MLLTFTTSTGSFFMLLGHVKSGRFSGSPGRSRILSLFLTSSIRSFAAFESSNRSFLTINGIGPPIRLLRILRPSCDDLDVGVDEADTLPYFSAPSKSAAANISAEVSTRRSDDVYIFQGCQRR